MLNDQGLELDFDLKLRDLFFHLIRLEEGIDLGESGDQRVGQATHVVVGQLRSRGITFVVARLKSPLARKLDDTGVATLIGAENLLPTVEGAVAMCIERSSGTDT